MTNPKQEIASSKSLNDSREIGPVTTSSTIGAALGVVIVWLFNLGGVDVPEGTQLAIVVLLTALGGWLVKPGTGKRRE